MIPLSSDAGYALTRRDKLEELAGLRSRQPISRRQFLSDVARLANRLPAHQYMVNLCADRYHFMVGFAAALRREQVTLLPANDLETTLVALASEYPDVYALADSTNPPLPVLPYPEALGLPLEAVDVPFLPAKQPAVVLFTSGTTGRPKRIAKSWGVLVRSARSAGTRLGIANFRGGTIIGTVPHQHSYGLESVILLALEHGLAVVVWSYARGSQLSKDGETAIDIVAYAAQIAAQLGAHVIKVKLPTEHLEQAAAKKVYESKHVPIKTLTERVHHVVQSAFDGRRIVIFSGGAAKEDDKAIYDEMRAIRDGGGFGSIIGRNSFQRKKDDALKLLRTITGIYAGTIP